MSARLRETLLVVALTRVGVLAIAFLSAVVIGAENESNSAESDARLLTRPFGTVGDALLTPLARWDSVWYLAIADHGYAPAGQEVAHHAVAFFPLYPLLVWIGSGFGASFELQLVAAFAVSLVAYAGALYLLHRLAELELGREHALPTIALLALFPGALFFGIPYSESLFLLVSVGAFYAARTDHWAWAGALAAAASATRSAGVLLLIPLAILYAQQRRGLRPDVLWLALAPLGIAAYCAYLGIQHGDALAWMDLQDSWMREFAGPFGGLVTGAIAAADGVRDLITGSYEEGFAARDAALDLGLFAFAVGAVVATVGVFRRLPLAYGVYVVAALSLPLSFPAEDQPLMSLPRFLAVLFPLFMWLALWAGERRRLQTVGIAFATLLAFFTAQYAAWEFIA
ncbi:MAG: hypothetical protein M3340_10060 [Actinomycetota bacterium]|nr:hypothetical protein [Actinomycetota bacterium]